MTKRVRVTAHQWIEQIFDAQAARNGGIVRRKRASVAQFASSDALEAAVRKRGFHMIETGDQYVIICNTGHFRMVL